MYVVNLFAQPGAGKSTGAAYIFAKLKMAGVNAELITEFAKDKVWEENKEVFKNQAYLFGKQYYRMSRCKDKVDVLVTDSPLLLSILYNNDDTLGREFNAMVGNVFNSFNNLNYWINRVKPYNPKGRHQTEEEADGLIPILRFIMRDNHIEWTEYRGIEEDYDKIVEDVLRHLKEFNMESMGGGLQIMNRMFGLMPSSEVKKEKSFKDSHGLTITIQAGPNGWTIIYGDSSSKWSDEESTTEENFDKAFRTAEYELGTLTEIKYETYGEV